MPDVVGLELIGWPLLFNVVTEPLEDMDGFVDDVLGLGFLSKEDDGEAGLVLGLRRGVVIEPAPVVNRELITQVLPVLLADGQQQPVWKWSEEQDLHHQVLGRPVG